MVDKNDIVKFMRDGFKKIGGSTAIIGVSGGKDSTVIFALCIEAFGKQNVVPVLLPNVVYCDTDGCLSDKTLGYKICKYYGYDNPLAIDVDDIYFNMTTSLSKSFENCGLTITEYSDMSILPRLRMTLLYSVAKQYEGGRVINTSNMSEYMLGWFTRYGDSAGDIAPIKTMYVSEVVELGKQLEVPVSFLCEPPRDDLTGRTDEQNFGFTYDEFELYMHNEKGVSDEKISKMISESNWKRLSTPTYYQ